MELSDRMVVAELINPAFALNAGCAAIFTDCRLVDLPGAISVLPAGRIIRKPNVSVDQLKAPAGFLAVTDEGLLSSMDLLLITGISSPSCFSLSVSICCVDMNSFRYSVIS